MTKYREILRLSSMGLSQRAIARSCQCSRNTVAKVLSRASEQALRWPLPDDLTDTSDVLWAWRLAAISTLPLTKKLGY